jgi:acetyltransferase-like isoleucine patch superfamily enzyme/acyl carrier protein
MSTAQSVSTHDHEVADNVLAQIQSTYSDLSAQDAFLVPGWYYQQNHWMEDSIDSENAVYNLPIAVRITGALDLAVLRKCLREVQLRHDVLRSIFRALNGRIFQVIVPPRDPALEVVDLSHLPLPARDAQLATGLSDEAWRPFDLTSDVLLRARLFRLGAQEHVLQLTTHHLVCDDWSSGILITELFALYDHFALGTGKPLSDLTFHYGDFIRWREHRVRDDVKRQAVLKTRLSGGSGFYHLKPDAPRPPKRTSHGATLHYALPMQLETALKRVSQEHKVTFFMALLAGFQSILHLISGDDDVGVGTCAANRPLPEVENLIGRFANDLVVRTDYSGDPTFREILSRTRDAALEGYSYQDLPFGTVLEELVPVANPSVTPLFQSMFILQNAPKINYHTGAITAERILFDGNAAKYDLAVWLRMEKSVDISFEYNSDLFREETIRRLIKDYETVLMAMVADPDKRVSELRFSLASMQAEPAGATLNSQDCTPILSPENIAAELIPLWREVLGVAEVRVTDEFFSLGGDSLRATQLLRRIQQRFGAELPFSSLFSSRTIQEQALAISRVSCAATGAENALPCAAKSNGLTVNDGSTLPRISTTYHKSLLRRVSNRFLHVLCRILPGATTVRPFLHRLRGIRIGKDVWIGDDVYLENEYPECVEIQDGAMIGLRSTIVAHTHGVGRVVIGRNAFIGAGSTVVTAGNRPLVIGEGAVLMASSLVTSNIEPNTLYGHDSAKPLAKVTKPFTEETSYEEFMTTLRPLSR